MDKDKRLATTIDKVKFVMENDLRVVSTNYEFPIEENCMVYFNDREGDPLHSVRVTDEDSLEEIDATIKEYFDKRR